MDQRVGIDAQQAERLVHVGDDSAFDEGKRAVLPARVEVHQRDGNILVLGGIEHVDRGFECRHAVQRQQEPKHAEGQRRLVDFQRQRLEHDHVGRLRLQDFPNLMVDDLGPGGSGPGRVGVDAE